MGRVHLTVLPQGERELLDAHERFKRRRARRPLALPLGHMHYPGVRLTVPRNAYAVWLYYTRHAARLLGFITQPRSRGGTLTTSGVLPSDAGRFRQILVTLESHEMPCLLEGIVSRSRSLDFERTVEDVFDAND